MEDNKVNLMDKKPDDLTVGEAIKVNLGVAVLTIGGMIAFPVAIGLAISGYEKVRDRVRARKTKKNAADIT